MEALMMMISAPPLCQSFSRSPWEALGRLGHDQMLLDQCTAIGQFIDEVWCGGVRPWGVTGQQQGPLGAQDVIASDTELLL